MQVVELREIDRLIWELLWLQGELLEGWDGSSNVERIAEVRALVLYLQTRGRTESITVSREKLSQAKLLVERNWNT